MCSWKLTTCLHQCQALYTGDEVSAKLIYVEDWQTDTSDRKGKISLTFLKDDSDILFAVNTLGGAGAIIARGSDYSTEIFFEKPGIATNYEVGSKILQYIRSTRLVFLFVVCYKRRTLIIYLLTSLSLQFANG